MSKSVEEWRDIEGYDGLYQVSDWGNVRNTKKNKNRKIQINKGGYEYIRICYNGIKTHYYIQRLVWQTFNGDIPEDMEVNHIDENKHNNHLDNLNILTPKENSNWGTRCQRLSESKLKCHPKAIKIEQYTMNGELVKIYPSARRAELDGFDHSHILECCNGVCKQHKGFIWKYA